MESDEVWKKDVQQWMWCWEQEESEGSTGATRAVSQGKHVDINTYTFHPIHKSFVFDL